MTEVSDEEKELLAQLEAGTSRIKQQSAVNYKSLQNSTQLISQISRETTTPLEALNEQLRELNERKRRTKDNTCSLIGIIILEFLVLVGLVSFGFS